MKHIHIDNKNSDIEVLRAYAIAITVVAHLNILVPQWYGVTSYFWLGGGVDLFFCISGFLITGTLMRKSQSHGFINFSASFLVKRAFRLWPAAILWATATLAISQTFNVETSFGPRDMVFQSWIFGVLHIENFHIFMIGNAEHPTPIWHYWSLSLEEQFYILLPIAIYFVKDKRFLIIPIVAFAVYQTTAIRPWGTIWWFIRSDALLYGVTIAILWHYHAAQMRKLLNASNRPLLIAIFIALLPLPVLLSKTSWSPYYMGFVSVSASALVLLSSANINMIGIAPKLRKLALYIGSRSYSIYLIHDPVLATTRELIIKLNISNLQSHTSTFLALIFALAATVALSEFSFRAIETPLRFIGNKISESWALKNRGAGQPATDNT